MKSESTFSKMRVSGLIVERRHISSALSLDLASHLSSRIAKGAITVVTSHPQDFMSSVHKQWLRLICEAQHKKARTINRRRKDNMEEIICGMQSVSFTAKDPADEPLAAVSFATVEQLTAAPPMCATLYITEPITRLNQYMLTAWMPPGGVVVIYEK